MLGCCIGLVSWLAGWFCRAALKGTEWHWQGHGHWHLALAFALAFALVLALAPSAFALCAHWHWQEHLHWYWHCHQPIHQVDHELHLVNKKTFVMSDRTSVSKMNK